MMERSDGRYWIGSVDDDRLFLESAGRLIERAVRDRAREMPCEIELASGADEFMELLDGHVDVVFANEAEATALFRTESFEEAASKLSALVQVAAVTRGPRGSVAIANGERVEVAAEPVGKVVDTTGAGDLYAAGFLHGLTRGRDLEACARLGGIAAAEIISHMGARPEVQLSKLAADKGL